MHTWSCEVRNDFVTFFTFICFDFKKIVSKYRIQTKSIMKKILLLSALLIASVSAAWSADHRVRVSGLSFTPSTVNAAVGDTVTWIWQNGMHTTTSTNIPPGARPWNAPLDTANTRFRTRLRAAGTYSYQCNFHFSQGMVGTIVVSAASPAQVPATH